VTWAAEALAAIRKIVLIEDRINNLTEHVKALADSYLELDRRMLRVEAKFELIERIGVSQAKRLPTVPHKKRARKK
jgi:hypothetical protein